MHRLLSARSIYHSGLQNITLPSSNSVSHSLIPEIKCSFCRKVLLGHSNIENLLLVRHQSTRTANALHKATKRKVKYKHYKKYGELLEVSEKSMTEKKVSISKLNAVQLSKLASSSVSLGELHQLTTKSQKQLSAINEVDPELLKKFRDKVLKKPSTEIVAILPEINLEDDKCALIFTNHSISQSLEEKLKTKQFMEMIKESYYNFRKATLYDQKLRDIHSAINEGLNQEFDLSHQLSKEDPEFEQPEPKKGPHAVFREIFFDNQLDSYDQELMSHISTLQASPGLPHLALEDIYDEASHELTEGKDDVDIEHDHLTGDTITKGLKVKKAQQKQKAKNKAKREKRRQAKEAHMKQDIREREARGKQAALHALLAAHLRLLCALDMPDQGNQVLQYYRSRSEKMPDQPKVTDTKVYNTLLHGYAAKGQYKQAQQLISSMVHDGVRVDAQTGAALFEAVERSTERDKMTLLRGFARLLEEKGITLNDLLNKSKFVYDQGEIVLKAIRRLDPDFEPVYTPPVIDYDCPLLEDLRLDKPENRAGLDRSPAAGLFTVDELKERARKQFDIEIKGEIEVKNIDLKDETSDTVKFYREKLSTTEAEWRGSVRAAFARNLSTLRSQSNASHAAISLYPYLKVLEVDQFVDLIMGELSKLVDGSETYSPTLKLLQRDLGSQVYHKYQIEQYRRNGVLAKMKHIYGEYCAWYVARSGALNPRQAWQLLQHQHRTGADLDIDEAPWPIAIRQNVGKFLYNIIINDVKIDVNMFKHKAKEKKLPAVYKLHRPWGRLVRLELKPHPALARLWSLAARPELRMRAALAPLTCPAAPWRNHRAQPYLLTHTPLIRMPLNVVSQERRLEGAAEALLPVLDGLNQLGEVPWTVNTPVLDLQLAVFRSGGDKKLDIPPPPSALDTSQFDDVIGQAGAGNAFRRRLAINRARAEMYSLWCDALYKLSLANHYRDDIFWLPHNMDFRGRVYACPPHLSQLGADPARALLVFANKRPLGSEGLRWLKLHAINLTGTMKRNTVDERLEYAETVLDQILDSADKPLEGQRWWTKSEEPWQTLACCMEIANAVRSPNPEEYRSGFPIHQDGSCNGLQHYAALGGDAAGAAAVNLAPRDRPRDVYTAVASKVEEMRIRDAEKGVKAAIVLENFVRRKVIKQTVMTTVYGVTKFGARLQIAKQLKDIDEFPADQVWACSQYLTARTFDSLREMFTSTKLIQDWLTDCAKLISGMCGESVEWVTPLGLPVVQPYYRRVTAGAAAAAAAPWDYQQRPCTMKQRNAFPPNFIHSLDSSHMLLTALRCQAAGLTFVSVHDCFWTHPDTVHHMNKICREQFVALHSQPILEDLSKFMVKRYSYSEQDLQDNNAGAVNKKRVNKLLTEVPPKGDFKLENVLKSVFFFS